MRSGLTRRTPRDGARQRLVVYRLIVERPVGLHVDQGNSVGAGEREDRADLIDDVGLDLLRARLHLAAAETPEIVVAWMGAHGDVMPGGEADGAIDDPRVAGVEPASHVRRAHELEESLFIGADVVDAEALPHVAVDVDSRHTPILR